MAVACFSTVMVRDDVFDVSDSALTVAGLVAGSTNCATICLVWPDASLGYAYVTVQVSRLGDITPTTKLPSLFGVAGSSSKYTYTLSADAAPDRIPDICNGTPHLIDGADNGFIAILAGGATGNEALAANSREATVLPPLFGSLAETFSVSPFE